MRIHSISNYYKVNQYKNNIGNVKSNELSKFSAVNNSSYKTQKCYRSMSIQFGNLFGEPSITDKINCGLQALDDKSILVVTDEKNKEDSLAILKNLSDKITIPISKIYVAVATEKDLGRRNYGLQNKFAIFKEDDEYKLLPLGSLYLDKNKGKASFDKNNRINIGEVKVLREDNAIRLLDTRGLDSIYFVFNTPKKYNPTPAEKYLEVRAINTTSEEISLANRIAITKLLNNEESIVPEQTKITFSDIGGLDNVIKQLKTSVLRPLKYPEVYRPIRINKGILLYGPPRCGKTMLGLALANEAGVEYKYMNANEFKASEVGESERMVRDVFQELQSKPMILFIDEFDAVAKEREGSTMSRYDDSLVNQILGCMSDLEKSKQNSFVIAATNKLELIDDAMKSSGRFGLSLEISLPDEAGISAIYDIYAKKIPFDCKNEEEKENLKEEICSKMFEEEFNGSDIAETFSIAYLHSLDRLGIAKKMDDNTFLPSDLKNIAVSKDDMDYALWSIINMKGNDLI